ncbi:ribose transport system permease protein [Aequitasia blattaphilus]|uniref:ABC transporter permease n=1 Tax=Aequitasia blattaphilus TaxID=2949332 RepID=A0ABT1E7N2_9FIRM|nr:ABC transporter permease [Aequitasia blattaphilus]MCP1101824.1 ABC transporter permease [Aequitasia blattaphilus]MCR8614464.1 ABC transporter permease [Aequitasia blattaphilus]
MSNDNRLKSRNQYFNVVRTNVGILCVMLLIGVILTFMTPNFLTVSNIISVLRQISNNIFLAIGMTLVIILGGIDLSVGSIVAMSGTLTVGFIVTNGLPMWPSILIGLLLGAFVGLFNGVVIAIFKVPAFIVTLSTMNIAKGIAYIYSGGRSTRITSEAYSMIGTGYLFGIIPLPVVYMFILIILFAIILNKTKFGTYVYAVGGNRESARLSGVPIKKVEIMVFTISGFLAAFAGIILSSRMYSGQPKAGDGYEMDAIAACVLGGISMSGGTGHLSGTVIGAIVIGIISNGLNLIGVSSFWQLLVKGFIILIAVIIDSQKEFISQKIQKSKRKN